MRPLSLLVVGARLAPVVRRDCTAHGHIWGYKMRREGCGRGATGEACAASPRMISRGSTCHRRPSALRFCHMPHQAGRVGVVAGVVRSCGDETRPTPYFLPAEAQAEWYRPAAGQDGPAMSCAGCRLARMPDLRMCDARPASLLYFSSPPRPMATGRDLHRPIADRPASEMSLETNILHHLANCLERKHGPAPGSITMTSPTQNEEADLGFDAVVGQPDGRYVALQFKRPDPCSTTPSFSIPAKQVRALSWWPPRSAFFVLPVVRTNRNLWDAGASLLDMSYMVDVWDLYARFDEIGLLGPGRRGHSASAVRTVRIAGDGRLAKVNTTKGRGWVEGDLRSDPISSLCSTGTGGIVVKNGKAMTWAGRKWDEHEWRHEAEGAWRRCAGQNPANPSSRIRSEHACKAWIGDMAGIVWAPQDNKETLRKSSPRDAGHTYLLRVGGLRSGKK